MPDLTMVFSGPLAQRAVVLAAFSRSEAPIEPSVEPRGHPYGLPDDDPSVGWVAVRGELEAAQKAAGRSGWTLRLHWPTPDCRACGGTGRVNHGTSGLGTCLHCQGSARTNRPVPSTEEQMAATIADLQARLAVLEGSV